MEADDPDIRYRPRRVIRFVMGDPKKPDADGKSSHPCSLSLTFLAMAKLSASLALAVSLFAVASAQLTILEPGGPDLWWSKFQLFMWLIRMLKAISWNSRRLRQSVDLELHSDGISSIHCGVRSAILFWTVLGTNIDADAESRILTRTFSPRHSNRCKYQSHFRFTEC
jgi:hypothetical protein